MLLAPGLYSNPSDPEETIESTKKYVNSRWLSEPRDPARQRLPLAPATASAVRASGPLFPANVFSKAQAGDRIVVLRVLAEGPRAFQPADPALLIHRRPSRPLRRSPPRRPAAPPCAVPSGPGAALQTRCPTRFRKNEACMPPLVVEAASRNLANNANGTTLDLSRSCTTQSMQTSLPTFSWNDRKSLQALVPKHNPELSMNFFTTRGVILSRRARPCSSLSERSGTHSPACGPCRKCSLTLSCVCSGCLTL